MLNRTYFLLLPTHSQRHQTLGPDTLRQYFFPRGAPLGTAIADLCQVATWGNGSASPGAVVE